jgi:hypothetical protein
VAEPLLQVRNLRTYFPTEDWAVEGNRLGERWVAHVEKRQPGVADRYGDERSFAVEVEDIARQGDGAERGKSFRRRCPDRDAAGMATDNARLPTVKLGRLH